MSRIAKAPVNLPQGVTATIAPELVTIKGAKGTLSIPLTRGVTVVQADKHLEIKYTDPGLSRTQAGATRAHIANMVTGVTAGYSKTMEIVGTGYRVTAKGSDLEFALGYSHPVVVPAPEGITFRVETPTRFAVEGIDKQKVGEVAANIRKLRKPDPYKGKGVRYQGEVIRRKAGKTGK